MANRKTINMQAWRCADNRCLDPTAEVEVETTARLWSATASWTNTGMVLPKADEDVEVMPGWNMIYDYSGDSPIY